MSRPNSTMSSPSTRSRRRARSLAAATVLAAALLAAGPAHAATSGDGTPVSPTDAGRSLASFEGGTIDLTAGWGAATACHVTTSGTHCYRSEAEMDAAEGLRPSGTEAGNETLAGVRTTASRLVLTCSITLRLYRSASYAGGVIAFDTRGVVVNLSTYGFDNDTSSYKTGACNATFWENANGGGAVYPGLTVANVSSPSMVAGWDNRVSSIAIA